MSFYYQLQTSVANLCPRKKERQLILIKKFVNIMPVALPSGFRKTSLTFSDKVVVLKYKGVWPSPKYVEQWSDKVWKPITKGNFGIFTVYNCFFAFIFEHKEDRDIVFQNGLYFFGSRGMSLNTWSLDFILDKDIPTIVHVWVKPPLLSLS